MNNLLQTPSFIHNIYYPFVSFVHDIYHPLLPVVPFWSMISIIHRLPFVSSWMTHPSGRSRHTIFSFPLSFPATNHLELSTTVCVFADTFIHSFEGLTLFTNCGAISLSSIWTTFRPLISRVWRASRQNLSRSSSWLINHELLLEASSFRLLLLLFPCPFSQVVEILLSSCLSVCVSCLRVCLRSLVELLCSVLWLAPFILLIISCLGFLVRVVVLVRYCCGLKKVLIYLFSRFLLGSLRFLFVPRGLSSFILVLGNARLCVLFPSWMAFLWFLVISNDNGWCGWCLLICIKFSGGLAILFAMGQNFYCWHTQCILLEIKSLDISL